MYCFEILRCNKNDCPVKKDKIRHCWEYFEKRGGPPDPQECPFAPCSTCHYRMGWTLGLIKDALFDEDAEQPDTSSVPSSNEHVKSDGASEPSDVSAPCELNALSNLSKNRKHEGLRFCWQLTDCPNPVCPVKTRRIIKCFKFFEPKGREEKERITCSGRLCSECHFRQGWDLGIITEAMFADVLEEKKLRHDRDIQIKRDTLVDIYLSELSKKTLSRDEELALARRMAGDKHAAELFLMANLKLVVRIASGYRNRGTGLMDLIQEGNIGLIKAISKFDYRLGYRFSTYAAYWIRYYMQKAGDQAPRSLRIPHHLLALAHRIKRAVSDYMGVNGRAPSLSELSERLGVTQKKIIDIVNITQTPLSIEGRDFDDPDSESSLEFFLTDKTNLTPEEQALERTKESECRKALAELPERERKIVEEYFGFSGETKSLAQIGRELGISRERTRQIMQKALKLLQSKEFITYFSD